MDKVILITGAGKGIGRATAMALARKGAFLFLCSRSKEDLASLKKKSPWPEKMDFLAGDATEEKIAAEAVQKSIQKFGRIDALINNVGVLTPRGPISTVKSEDWDTSLRVNLKAPFLFIKHTLPHMQKQKKGTLINVTSGAGQGPAPSWGPYGVSKLALEGLGRLVQQESSEAGIRVLSVNPGGTRTRMRAAAYPKEDPSTLPTPNKVAEIFVWLLENETFTSDKPIHYREWSQTSH